MIVSCQKNHFQKTKMATNRHLEVRYFTVSRKLTGQFLPNLVQNFLLEKSNKFILITAHYQFRAYFLSAEQPVLNGSSRRNKIKLHVVVFEASPYPIQTQSWLSRASFTNPCGLHAATLSGAYASGIADSAILHERLTPSSYRVLGSLDRKMIMSN